MRRGMRCLDAAALIDRHVHDHRALLHLVHHRLGDDLRRSRARNQHAADHQVGLATRPLDVVAVRSHRKDAPAEDVIQLTQPVQIQIDQRHLRTHTERNLRRIRAHDPAADDAHIRRRNARNAAQQNAAPAMLLLKISRAHLHAHAPGDFAHRSQQRQRASTVANGLIGDARDLEASSASVSSVSGARCR